MLLKAKHLNARILKAEKGQVFFSVPKKLAKLAVQRNKLKRMARLAAAKYIDRIKNVSIQIYFTSLPQNQSEVDKDVAEIMQNIK